MAAIDLVEDIHPISHFRANSAALLEQVETTGRPVVLTQRGRSAAVLVSAAAWQGLQDEVEALRALVGGRGEAELGEVVSDEDARQRMASRVR